MLGHVADPLDFENSILCTRYPSDQTRGARKTFGATYVVQSAGRVHPTQSKPCGAIYAAP
eukprot:1237650-Pyramimonas_sp.AAC.1